MHGPARFYTNSFGKTAFSVTQAQVGQPGAPANPLSDHDRALGRPPGWDVGMERRVCIPTGDEIGTN